MELFSALKNAQVCCAFEIINFAVAQDGKISLPQIRKIANRWQLLNYREVSDFLCSADICILRPTEKKPGEYQLTDTELKAIPSFFTSYEMDYLGYILQQPLAKLFLDAETISKLQAALPEGGFDSNEYIRIIEPLAELPPEVAAQDFRNILIAIEQGREIGYEYTTNCSSEVVSVVCIPYRVEYSAYDKRFWLILYDKNTERTIKAKLNHIRHVKIGAFHGIEEETIRQAINNLKSNEKLVLKVTDRKNALERCFLLFENQERIESTQLGADTYLLSMKYFSFDEAEILRKLLYLGQHVTIAAPQSLRQKFIDRLDKILAVY